jgi:hypothetical protein
MSPIRIARAACLAAFAVLGGCDTHYRHHFPMDPAFGNATRHNQALHAVDLDPAWAKDTDVGGDGQRVKKATDRYYGGEVIKPEAVTIK